MVEDFSLWHYVKQNIKEPKMTDQVIRIVSSNATKRTSNVIFNELRKYQVKFPKEMEEWFS
jgi:hypothetical protein